MDDIELLYMFGRTCVGSVKMGIMGFLKMFSVCIVCEPRSMFSFFGINLDVQFEFSM